MWDNPNIFVIKDKILELAEYLGKTIIFVRTRNSAGILHRALVDIGYPITTTQGAVLNPPPTKPSPFFNSLKLSSVNML
jgi:hypothetical protein